MRALLVLLVLLVGLLIAAQAVALKAAILDPHESQIATYVALTSDQEAP